MVANRKRYPLDNSHRPWNSKLIFWPLSARVYVNVLDGNAFTSIHDHTYFLSFVPEFNTLRPLRVIIRTGSPQRWRCKVVSLQQITSTWQGGAVPPKCEDICLIKKKKTEALAPSLEVCTQSKWFPSRHHHHQKWAGSPGGITIQTTSILVVHDIVLPTWFHV